MAASKFDSEMEAFFPAFGPNRCSGASPKFHRLVHHFLICVIEKCMLEARLKLAGIFSSRLLLLYHPLQLLRHDMDLAKITSEVSEDFDNRLDDVLLNEKFRERPIHLTNTLFMALF